MPSLNLATSDSGFHLVCSVHRGETQPLFDENYLSALRDRDPDAENFLISHFSRPVQLKLRARLRSPELIQDACQETFLRVIRYFSSGKTLDNPASLPGFIHTVCHNVALELLRSQRVNRRCLKTRRISSIPRPAPRTSLPPDSVQNWWARVLERNE